MANQWAIEFGAKAQKQISKLDPQTRQQIAKYLKKVVISDNPTAMGKALTGPYSGYWRYRVGDYRIIIEIRKQILTVFVVSIGHRSDVYD